MATLTKKDLKKDQIFDVEVAGVKLRLRSSHNPEFVNKVVQHVNTKIKEALPVTKTESIQTASILACLNMAEEQLLLKQQLLADLEKVEAKAEDLVSRFHTSFESRVELDH